MAWCGLQIISLVPRLSWGRGKESLVTIACACMNPYQQNMVSQFSHKTAFQGDKNQCLSDLPHSSLLDTIISRWQDTS